MTLDYFVVGPNVALRSRLRSEHPHRLDFAVLDPHAGEVGQLRAELRDGRIEIETTLVEDGRAGAAEAIRLAAGVCSKLARADVVVRSGPFEGSEADELVAHAFEAADGGAWRLAIDRVASDAARAKKAASMEALYRDPFRVVWNFEPLPWTLIGPFAEELRPFLPTVRVLDLGCGFGGHAVRLEELGFEVHGIDIAPAAIAQCRRWVEHPERFHAASAAELPFPGGFFGGVLDVGCLHCVDPPLLPAAVAEIERVLVPGGLLYSRFLAPQPPAWLAGQAFRVEQLGRSGDELSRLFEPHFQTTIFQDGQPSSPSNYIRAVSRS